MTELRRSLSFPLMVLYGLGTTIGAGIYALLGKVTAQAGGSAPLSFLVASVLAGFTALSFAELSSRFPKSAGSAVYVKRGLSLPGLPAAVGLLVVTAGCISAATVCHGFVGYLRALYPVPAGAALLGVVLGLGAVAAWGIRQSVTLAALVTVVEVAGLVLVAGAASLALGQGASTGLLALPESGAAWRGVLGASLLAFYAFLGFEDMVTVAEEVRHVRRVLPRAILVTLALTAALYGLLASLAVSVVPPAELGASEAPLVLVYARSGGPWPAILAWIGVVAMLNGALIQVIMASRVLYGLAEEGELPGRLARVHPRTRTPLLATALSTASVAGFALALPIERLAEATSAITLLVFALVNVALVVLKGRPVAPPPGILEVPLWVPAAGAAVSAGFLVYELAARLAAE